MSEPIPSGEVKTQPDLTILEARLTPQNREQVRKYIRNCNEGLYATILLGAFDESLGRPISNAFYLHELEELQEFRRRGHEFVNVTPTEELQAQRRALYDTDRQPHLSATLLHCQYLQMLAEQEGHIISLGTCLEYDPISSQEDKEALRKQDNTLTANDGQAETAKQFFRGLAKQEKKIFDQPFSMGNTDMYRNVIFEK